MSLAFCWKMDKGKVTMGKISTTKKPYKHVYTFGDTAIPVFEISQFPEQLQDVLDILVSAKIILTRMMYLLHML